MARVPHPFAGWVVTRTGVATFAALLAALIAGVVVNQFPGDSAFARWLASDTGLFAYWILCAFVVSIAQMALHALGYPTARKRDADR